MFSTWIPPGTPSIIRRTLSLSSPQVENRITTAIIRPIIGSRMLQPVQRIRIPESTTPTETMVSANICRYAPFTLRSCSFSFMKNNTVKPLNTTPIPAVIIIGHPPTSSGTKNFLIHSVAIAPTAKRRIAAFNKDASAVALRKP